MDIRQARFKPATISPLFRLVSAHLGATAAVFSVNVAGLAWVEEHTQSSAYAGLSLFSSIGPALLSSLVAGAVVDGFGRARLLRVGHLGRGVAALVFWLGTTSFPQSWILASIFVSNAGLAFLTQFAESAELSLLPDLVARERLLRANSLLQIGHLSGQGAGVIVLAPLVIHLLGAPATGLLGALLCVLALALAVRLPEDASSVGRIREKWAGWRAFWADLRTGWRTIVGDHRLAVAVVQTTVAAAILLVLVSLLPGVVARQWDLPVENAPFVILPGGAGYVLGMILVSRWERLLNRHAWISTGLFGAGMAVTIVGFLSELEGKPAFVLSLGAILLVGVGLALVIIPGRAVLQEHPPAGIRGRVIAAYFALANATSAVPLILGGALADEFGFTPVIVALGLVAIGVSAGARVFTVWKGSSK